MRPMGHTVDARLGSSAPRNINCRVEKGTTTRHWKRRQAFCFACSSIPDALFTQCIPPRVMSWVLFCGHSRRFAVSRNISPDCSGIFHSSLRYRGITIHSCTIVSVRLGCPPSKICTTTRKSLVFLARSSCCRLHKSLCISRRRCKQSSSHFASLGRQDVAVFFWDFPDQTVSA